MSLDVELYLYIPVKTGSLVKVTFFESNYTHNMLPMAEAAGLRCVWHPEEFPELERVWHPDLNSSVLAENLIPFLEKGITTLKADPDHFKSFNPENGWGDYDSFVQWLEELLSACKEHPISVYSVDR